MRKECQTLFFLKQRSHSLRGALTIMIFCSKIYLGKKSERRLISTVLWMLICFGPFMDEEKKYLSSRLFENEPNNVCRYLSAKVPN